MKVYTKDEFYSKKNVLLKKIKEGAVFIYPTDTIYGIGCDARNFESVKKIYELKETRNMPFSVIAPSKKWIIENCDIDSLSESWLKKLPGPYTIILRLKNKKGISKNVILDKSTLGVRLPKHWISEVVEKLGFPIVTTSANKTGYPFMKTIKNLDSDIKEKVDFIIYEGEKENRPSTIINLGNDNVMISER